MALLNQSTAFGPKQPSAAIAPNFLYLGTSKAGSTWIYRVLADHPQVYLAPGKGTYYFDHHYDKGWDWYLEHFCRAQDARIVGDISHSYLFSRDAVRRIANALPNAKLMVCLREPVERSFSDYLDSVKNGKFQGSFADALAANPALIERGRYATWLGNYLEVFPRQQIHIAIFDDLRSAPQQFANELFAFLGIEPYELGSSARQKIMPAARPRFRPVAKWAKRLARLAERIGLQALRGRAKRSTWVRHLLYRPYRPGETPTIDPPTEALLRDQFRCEISRLDEMLETTLSTRWKYT